MNKWTDWIEYGGEIPTLDLPTINMPEGAKEDE